MANITVALKSVWFSLFVQVSPCKKKFEFMVPGVLCVSSTFRWCYIPIPLTREASRVILNSCRVCSTRMREFTREWSFKSAVSSYICAVIGHSARSAIQWCSRWSLWTEIQHQSTLNRWRFNGNNYVETFGGQSGKQVKCKQGPFKLFINFKEKG